MKARPRFFRRAWRRSVLCALVALLGLCAQALWLFRHDGIDYRRQQDEQIIALTAKREGLREAIAAVAERRQEGAAAMAAQETRARQAEKIITELQALESTWDRLVGNPAQQKANAEQIKRMEETRDAARAKAAATKQELTRLTWEKDGLELDMGRADRAIMLAEEDRSAVRHYLTLAWQRTRGWWLALFALYAAVEFAAAKRRKSESGVTQN